METIQLYPPPHTHTHWFRFVKRLNAINLKPPGTIQRFICSKGFALGFLEHETDGFPGGNHEHGQLQKTQSVLEPHPVYGSAFLAEPVEPRRAGIEQQFRRGHRFDQTGRVVFQQQ